MCGTLDNMELRQNYPLFCRKNTLYQISFYPHERTVTPRYLSLSITDSVTSHQPPWSFGFDSQTRAPPPRSLVRDGRTSPHRLRLVVSCSTCPPIYPPPHANSFVLGPAVINTHTFRRLESLPHPRLPLPHCHTCKHRKGRLGETSCTAACGTHRFEA
jgi:hypothetical protein